MIILAIGDVVGSVGLTIAERHIRALKTQFCADFVIANGENLAAAGFLPEQADRLLAAGADCVTLGNHAFAKKESFVYLDDNRYLLRPANYAAHLPGRGIAVFDVGRERLAVVNLIGRCGMDFGPDNPFTAAERIIKEIDGQADAIIVDFHAEATSEKTAMAHMLAGRVSAVFGTHTHVQTADARIINGTGYITDIGMTGAYESVIGVEVASSIEYFLSGAIKRYKSADGAGILCGAAFTIEAGRCVDVTPVRVGP